MPLRGWRYDVVLPCCPVGNPSGTQLHAHVRSRVHCRALIARAVAGESVPADVLEVMRLDGEAARQTCHLALDAATLTAWASPFNEILAHAVAPGAEKMRNGGDSWLLRLNTTEGTWWRVIVELPGGLPTCIADCPDCGVPPTEFPGVTKVDRDHRCVTMDAWRPWRVLTVKRGTKPLHLREQHTTLADACKVLLRTGPVQAARTVRTWLRDPPCDLALLHDGLAVLARGAGVPALEVAVDAALAGEARERVIDAMEAV